MPNIIYHANNRFLKSKIEKRKIGYIYNVAFLLFDAFYGLCNHGLYMNNQAPYFV